MICYKDMTFCRRSDCATYQTCFRSYTPEVARRAEKWWSHVGLPPKEEVPVAFSFFIDCFEEKGT